MARFLLQAVNNEDHLAPAQEVFRLDGLESATISVAFMTAAGLSLLEDTLRPIADRTRIIVGIRNGVTTAQAIQKALEIGCETYMVDTGSRHRIFHPKLYYARSAVLAKLLLGSANLTMGGLRTNIEASVLQELDPVVDSAFLDDLEDKLAAIVTNYPQNVILAVDATQLEDLCRSGRLLDEREARLPEPAGSSADRALDNIPRMELLTAPLHAPALPARLAIARARLERVWESNGLTERHLNIPTGGNTNPTGSMLFGLGAFEGIDQQKYFRDDVFAALAWAADDAPARKHLERAWADFRVVIKNLDYGEYRMKLTHNTLDTPAIRAARNSKTQLHWGEVKPLVARRDLLGSSLRLFRATADRTRFTLEIG